MIGFSKQTREVKVFHFDGKNGEFLGFEKVIIPPNTGLPADCTIVPPPAWKDGYALVWKSDVWDYRPDHRGKIVYEKATGKSSEITEIGDIPDSFTTTAPDVEYPQWNNGAWVVNDALRDSEKKEQAESQKKSLLAQAYEMIRPLDYAEKIGALTEEESVNHKILMKFIVEISRIDTGSPESIVWPSLTFTN